MSSVDIVIAGGGVAGLTAAAAFGAAGYTVVLADPAPAVAAQNDQRTTAFLQPARALLEQAGVWPLIAGDAADLRVMRIVDAAKQPAVSADFVSDEISDQPFGWNFPNALLRAKLLERIAALPQVQIRFATRYESHLAQDADVRVQLSDGIVRARLLIGADGRASNVREQAGIKARASSFAQKAVVFSVTHSQPHDNVSIEVHRSGGPFTLVPLPDRDGKPCSSVVWMENGARAEDLMALDDAAFIAAAQDRSADVLGQMALASKRQLWPIIAQRAAHITAPRVALMAEAAHVMPPIGAQGLNMSLADLAALLDLATPAGLGGGTMLRAYARRREADIALRMAGVAALNHASIAALPGIGALRARGLRAIHGPKVIRQALMRLGLGVR
ncbi:FAD-dependent monooxygenase [Ketogulonicigenium vulgare]|uniref:Ubiquinone biosynthesis hydroxylase, UbiH/UbiF/VisC/COQ6 family protein n=1 Tax=Ketogulonicigenium vulgare (strain WSH-001) TaxID=759362 RepID=F9Y3B0_KETVW|nr:FAD-dependent monooxygenase [Ketogulonicigenium vulgare]ADO42147.1 2-octaprenyl-6-methoxyphenyl hydroxylase [Ketogulonicigenium vulgare Y25]AEM40351.1 Ubiquinone biosynthesis hydroxylase, UbiH/UbiF/VisC/COQ6 family protein [Ketogulonicigenium vulgare WSH-001]ALJ80544.1 2-octaprenyl-6-methoxyphenyl hydroxylase [Ketogulonicigenium vulgare]ANW33365.1 2-octaprenyl-6-methoxyphenyl hydroxylase [Ketogulonicigenium vulgare]AOZ54064.1 2-octaprenyl-6-methoxyphenyl hydroxylase [Ketogulonicigenium vulg